jgi:hypothetical protein
MLSWHIQAVILSFLTHPPEVACRALEHLITDGHSPGPY